MKRFLTLALVFGAAPLIWAQDGRVWTPELFVLNPYGRMPASVPGVVGRESRAVALGNQRSPLGIYVYDPQGNCVAFDDEPTPKYFDDRIASWVPGLAGPYEVQVRNLGPCFNKIDASAR